MLQEIEEMYKPKHMDYEQYEEYKMTSEGSCGLSAYDYSDIDYFDEDY